MFYEKKMKNKKLSYYCTNMINKQFKNQHKVALMLLNRSWKKNNSNRCSCQKLTPKKTYIKSPLRREIIFYTKRRFDQLNVDTNDFMRYKKKYHLIAI